MTFKGAVMLGFGCLALVTIAALVTRANVLASQAQTADEQSEQTMGPPARAAESNQPVSYTHLRGREDLGEEKIVDRIV